LGWWYDPLSRCKPRNNYAVHQKKEQFLAQSDSAMQTLLDPIMQHYANDSGFRQPDGLITATLVRARFAQLNRLNAMQVVVAEQSQI
jgi:hypothetical protein